MVESELTYRVESELPYRGCNQKSELPYSGGIRIAIQGWNQNCRTGSGIKIAIQVVESELPYSGWNQNFHTGSGIRIAKQGWNQNCRTGGGIRIRFLNVLELHAWNQPHVL